jgi:hypothetical protein
LLSQMLSKRLNKFQRGSQVSGKAWKPTKKTPIEKSS